MIITCSLFFFATFRLKRVFLLSRFKLSMHSMQKSNLIIQIKMDTFRRQSQLPSLVQRHVRSQITANQCLWKSAFCSLVACLLLTHVGRADQLTGDSSAGNLQFKFN